MDRLFTAPARRDLVVACLLACGLGLAWTLRDWSNLAALRLPDTDDGMRLQQIRDWLGGQSFGDLAQHRLGAAGLEMHWSRLPDLLPAASIALLTPLLGSHVAEMAAVILWPLLLFAAALAVTAAIARRLGVSGPIAAVIAALAYPATTLFMPGRIDHHGLQLVLLLVIVRTLLGSGTRLGGALAGLATVASLAIGIETAPLLALAALIVGVLWILDEAGAQARLAAYGATLTLGTAAASALLRTTGWNWPACDGFDAQLWRGAQIAALSPLLLAVSGFVLKSARARLLAASLIGGSALALALLVSPACLHPYGAVDPLLAQLWLAHVEEAQPLFGAPADHAIGYAGGALVGLLAGAWMAWRTRASGWLILFAFQLVAMLVTAVQLRGAYSGALLAAPALAALIAAARAKNVLLLAAAWLASFGMTWPLIGAQFAPRAESGSVAAGDCTSPQALARIAALPQGTLMAPVDLGAFVLASSRHRVIAAPYHRNGQGNRAMYQFFLNTSGQSEALARRWGIDYVALCPGSFAELGTPGDTPDRLVDELQAGRVPAWLKPLSRPGDAPMLYTLTPRN